MKIIEKGYCAEVRKSRHEFLKSINPYRNDLFRFCRALTKKPWDAEDLVQETIAKAYSKLGEVWLDGIQNPKSYLFRMATNTWFDQCRKQGLMNSYVSSQLESTPTKVDTMEIRAALQTMLIHLPPRERVSLLLKDVFDYSLEEIAIITETTVGAVKSALSRGRDKMEKMKTTQYQEPTANLNSLPQELIDNLVANFNNRNMDGMISLFLEHASGEVYGTVQEWSRDEIRRGSMGHTIYDGNGQPLPAGFPKAQFVEVFGEKVLVILEKENKIDDVLRFRSEDGQISHFTSYYFCPEVLTEVAEVLKMPVNTHPYYYFREA